MLSRQRPAALFWMLGIMPGCVFSSSHLFEHFLKISEDHGVQQLTFESSMNKKLARKKLMAGLTGLAPV